jgi:hypothetical protein
MHYIRLADGTVVSSDSEEWRHLCEARAIDRLPTKEERDRWLAAIAVRRGEAEAERLRATMKRLLSETRR